MTKVTIEVRTVGQAFGCEGVVMRGQAILATTRVYPYGQRANAYSAALARAYDFAAANGWTVDADADAQ